jgi:4-hydroxy-tetrahydrodipicolinate synthase
MTTKPKTSSALSQRFAGVVPPLVTPLLSDGSLDLHSLERHTHHLVEAGVHGLFALGSTGEVAYLSDEQRLQVTATIVRAAAGRVPVIAGAIDLTASRVLERALPLVDLGVDAVVSTAPLYALNDRAEIEQHFRRIARGLSVPLFAYDVPVRVPTKLAPELLVELGQEGVIVGCKDSSGDDVTFRRLIALNEAAGHPLQLFTGHEVIVDAMAFVGADGVVPGLGNVDAAGYVRLWSAAARGDWATARHEQLRLNALFEIVFTSRGRSPDAAGVGSFKAAMNLLGLIDHATMATPVEPLDDQASARVRRILAGLELLAA